jgi:hypothetical protein
VNTAQRRRDLPRSRNSHQVGRWPLPRVSIRPGTHAVESVHITQYMGDPCRFRVLARVLGRC